MKREQKKLLLITAAALLMATACGGKGGSAGNTAAPAETAAETEVQSETQSEVQPEAQAVGSLPETVYQSLSDRFDLSDMILADDDYIFNYYGIDPSLTEGYVFAFADDPVSADSVILMQAKEEADAEGLAESLSLVKEAKEAEMENYAPEAYKVAHAASVRRKGPFVYLVMHEKAAEMEKAIEELLP